MEKLIKGLRYMLDPITSGVYVNSSEDSDYFTDIKDIIGSRNPLRYVADQTGNVPFVKGDSYEKV